MKKVRRSSDGADNVDAAVIEHWGQEWSRFPQREGWGGDSLRQVFNLYFEPLPENVLNSAAIVGDFGAGSGRWAMLVAPQVAHLYVVEPSVRALQIARDNLAGRNNVTFLHEAIGGPAAPECELDLAYALGVLHHLPSPERGLREIRASVKPGGYFLGYMYYSLDDRPVWYRAVWRATDLVRRVLTRWPGWAKPMVTDMIALVVYFPLARIARFFAQRGVDTSGIPLRQYADKSFYVMRNDAMDRFGAPIEHRFSRADICNLVSAAGFDASTLRFAEQDPYWRFSVRNVT